MEREISQEDTHTQPYFMYIRGISYYEDNDYKKAVECFQKAADAGIADAMNILGSCYLGGTGVTKSDKKGFEWYSRAADAGCVEAVYNMARCYDRGIGIQQNDARAAEFYASAADKGHAEAMNSLACCYQTGQGVARDYFQSFKWFRNAALQGNVTSFYNLGCCYQFGRGVRTDMKEALHWYVRASKKGSLVAMETLAYCYGRGLGVQADSNKKDIIEKACEAEKKGSHDRAMELLVEAIHGPIDYESYSLKEIFKKADRLFRENEFEEALVWYKIAADRGDAGAMKIIGTCYKDACGVSKDYGKALEWFRKAALKGNGGAMLWLGIMYKSGWGVPEDQEKQALFQEARRAMDGGNRHKSMKLLRKALGEEQSFWDKIKHLITGK